MSTTNANHSTTIEHQIDASHQMVIHLLIVLFMIMSGILSLVFAVAIVLVTLCSLGLKMMLRLVLSRPETYRAFQVAMSAL